MAAFLDAFRGAMIEVALMISRKLNCIFVHIPKTGGTSIEDVIWPGARTAADLWMGIVAPLRNKYQTGGLQHLLARQIRAEVGELFERCFRFSFVRNPWDKAVSQFAYMQDRPELRTYIGMEADDSFSRYLSLIQEREHVQWMQQTDFVLDERGKTLVDFVGRFENLEADASKIFERVGVHCGGLPHRLQSARRQYQDYYNAQTRSIVGRLYERDADIFQYTFGR